MIISVIIPSFNRFETLARCLDAITNQTISADKYEILIIDDCSTDNTEEQAKIYINNAKEKNIRYIKNKKNLGIARTRNVGVRNALGRILVFLDNDLLVNREFLECHLNKHENVNDYKLAVVSNVTYKPEYLKKSNFGTYIQSRAIGYRSNKEMIGIDMENLPDNYFAGGGSSCTKRFAVEIGMFEENLSKYGVEDELFGFRLKKNGGRISFCNEAKILHDDPNVFPYYWKIKYQEMGRYSLKTLKEKEPTLFNHSLYRYLLEKDFSKDNAKTLFKKVLISIVTNPIIRKLIEYYTFKTDGNPNLRLDFFYRYLTVAWMRHGYVTTNELDKVKY